MAFRSSAFAPVAAQSSNLQPHWLADDWSPHSDRYFNEPNHYASSTHASSTHARPAFASAHAWPAYVEPAPANLDYAQPEYAFNGQSMQLAQQPSNKLWHHLNDQDYLTNNLVAQQNYYREHAGAPNDHHNYSLPSPSPKIKVRPDLLNTDDSSGTLFAQFKEWVKVEYGQPFLSLNMTKSQLLTIVFCLMFIGCLFFVGGFMTATQLLRQQMQSSFNQTRLPKNFNNAPPLQSVPMINEMNNLRVRSSNNYTAPAQEPAYANRQQQPNDLNNDYNNEASDNYSSNLQVQEAPDNEGTLMEPQPTYYTPLDRA